jgi:hypothetical protein
MTVCYCFHAYVAAGRVDLHLRRGEVGQGGRGQESLAAWTEVLEEEVGDHRTFP